MCCIVQVSGADYADDLASPAGELYAAIVTAPYAPATFDPATDVDATEALVSVAFKLVLRLRNVDTRGLYWSITEITSAKSSER